jgi:hypothetical protein
MDSCSILGFSLYQSRRVFTVSPQNAAQALVTPLRQASDAGKPLKPSPANLKGSTTFRASAAFLHSLEHRIAFSHPYFAEPAESHGIETN